MSYSVPGIVKRLPGKDDSEATERVISDRRESALTTGTMPSVGMKRPRHLPRFPARFDAWPAVHTFPEDSLRGPWNSRCVCAERDIRWNLGYPRSSVLE